MSAMLQPWFGEWPRYMPILAPYSHLWWIPLSVCSDLSNIYDGYYNRIQYFGLAAPLCCWRSGIATNLVCLSGLMTPSVRHLPSSKQMVAVAMMCQYLDSMMVAESLKCLLFRYYLFSDCCLLKIDLSKTGELIHIDSGILASFSWWECPSFVQSFLVTERSVYPWKCLLSFLLPSFHCSCFAIALLLTLQIGRLQRLVVWYFFFLLMHIYTACKFLPCYFSVCFAWQKHEENLPLQLSLAIFAKSLEIFFEIRM